MIFEHRIWPDQPVNVSLPDDFGLDVIGTCMVTVCKDKTMAFELVNETEMKDRSSFERLFGGAFFFARVYLLTMNPLDLILNPFGGQKGSSLHCIK